MRPHFSFSALAALVVCSACRDAAGLALECEVPNENRQPGITVSAVDSSTGALLAALRTGRVDVFDGRYSEQLEAGPLTPGGVAIQYWLGAMERSGTYTVRVEAPGFRTWERAGVVVTRGPDCHVRTVAVVAPMQRK
jgi:hypothetical protein